MPLEEFLASLQSLESTESPEFSERLKPLVIQLFQETDPEEINNILNTLEQKRMLDAHIHLSLNGQAVTTTLLHLAVEANRSDLVHQLIQRNADIDAENKDHMTPLMKAQALENTAISGLLNKEALYQELIQSKDSKRIITILHELKLEKKPNTHISYIEDGMTHFIPLLHEAISNNNFFLVRTLISYGADINLQDSNGNTAIMIAIMDTTPEMFTSLCNVYNPNSDVVNNQGETAITLLWSAYTRTPQKYFPALVALCAGIHNQSVPQIEKEITNILRRYHAALKKSEPLLDAIKNRDQRITELLLRDKKININAIDGTNKTHLNRAMQKRFKKNEVIFLLKMGAIPKTDTELKYCTPLLKITLEQCLAQNDIRSAVNIMQTYAAIAEVNALPENLKKDIQAIIVQYDIERHEQKNAFQKWISGMGAFFSAKPAFDLFKSEENAMNQKLIDCLGLPALQVKPETTIVQALPKTQSPIIRNSSNQSRLYTILSTQENALFLGQTNEADAPEPDLEKPYVELWLEPGITSSMLYIIYDPKLKSTRIEKINLNQALPSPLDSQYLPRLQAQLIEQLAPKITVQGDMPADSLAPSLAAPPSTIKTQTRDTPKTQSSSNIPTLEKRGTSHTTAFENSTLKPVLKPSELKPGTIDNKASTGKRTAPKNSNLL